MIVGVDTTYTIGTSWVPTKVGSIARYNTVFVLFSVSFAKINKLLFQYLFLQYIDQKLLRSDTDSDVFLSSG